VEGFFLESLQADIWTVEFVYRTYGNSLDLLPFDYGVQIINQGFESAKMDKMWSLYVQIYPFMKEENFMTFENFVKDSTRPPEPQHTAEQILDKTEKILNLKWKKEVI
jgi:hypothetical protein